VVAAERYYSLNEIAAELSFSPETVRRMVISGAIPGGVQEKSGCAWRVPGWGLCEYLSKSRVKHEDKAAVV
jgi:hypothetical protein